MPDASGLPTVWELRGLPPNALLAYAVRIGERAREVAYFHGAAWDGAVSYALRMTASKARQVPPTAALDELYSSYGTALNLLERLRSRFGADPTGLCLQAIRAVLDGCASIVKSLPVEMASDAIAIAGENVVHAVSLAFGSEEGARVVAAVYADYAELMGMTGGYRAGQAIAVDPDVLGPLWPMGFPSKPDWEHARLDSGTTSDPSKNDVLDSPAIPILYRHKVTFTTYEPPDLGLLEAEIRRWDPKVVSVEFGEVADLGGSFQVLAIVRGREPDLSVKFTLSETLLRNATAILNVGIRFEEPETIVRRTAAATQAIDIYFDTAEFTPEEMGRTLALMSELYRSIGGDELIIEEMGVFDTAGALAPVGEDDGEGGGL